MIKTAFTILISLIILVFVMPFFYSVSPYELNRAKILEASSLKHLFRTDRLGRDIYRNILFNTNI